MALRLVKLSQDEFPQHDISYGLAHRKYWTGWRYQELMRRYRGVKGE